MSEETTKRIELRSTISHGNNEYHTLDLRPPRIGERVKAEQRMRNGVSVQSMTEMSVALLASVAGVNEAVIMQMDGDQFEEASAFLQSFFERGRATGGTSAST